jgi:hypothetical protein
MTVNRSAIGDLPEVATFTEKARINHVLRSSLKSPAFANIGGGQRLAAQSIDATAEAE